MGFGIPVRNGLSVGLGSYATLSSGRATPWTPAKITTAVWLDASDSATVVLNGSTVSQWNDKSGNGRNITQSTATNQPTYATSALNGKPALSFDGTNDFLNADGTIFANTSYSFTLVIARSSSKVQNLICGGTGTTTNSNLLTGWNSNTNFVFSQYSNDVNYVVPGYTTTTPVLIGQHLDVNIGRNLYFNGTGVASSTNKTALSSNNGWIIGGWSTFYFQGIMSEIVITSAELSTDNRQKLEGYLAWKWGGF